MQDEEEDEKRRGREGDEKAMRSREEEVGKRGKVREKKLITIVNIKKSWRQGTEEDKMTSDQENEEIKG